MKFARCSKTLYTMLSPVLPRDRLVAKFGWCYRAKNVMTRWKLSRKRHESNKYCVGCGRESRKKRPDNINEQCGLSRVLKPPLRMCNKCWGDSRSFDNNRMALETVRTFWTRLKRRKIEPELRDNAEQIIYNDAKVGDTLVPLYYRNKDDTHYTVLGIERCTISQDRYIIKGGYVEAETGCVWLWHNETQTSASRLEMRYTLHPRP